MPFLPKRPCRQPGCGELVDSGYCEKCQSKRPTSLADDHRGNSAERGYDAKWRRFRYGYLERHPLCESKWGCVLAATQIHHIVKLRDGGAKYDEANLQPLCDYHHAALGGAGGRG
jgi:5-methylcytosine-specific restriction protein A